MSFNNSSLTIATMRENVEFDSQETLTNKLFIRALNKMLMIYQRAEREAYPQRYRNKTTSQSITSAGLDLLAVITDLGSDQEGFRVYRDAIRPQNLLPETGIGSRRRGYYILSDGKLFLTPEGLAPTTIIIRYVTATTRIADSADTSTLIPIDQDAELLCEDFVLGRFYKREGQGGLQVDQEQRFLEELRQFFRKPTRAVAL